MCRYLVLLSFALIPFSILAKSKLVRDVSNSDFTFFQERNLDTLDILDSWEGRTSRPFIELEYLDGSLLDSPPNIDEDLLYSNIALPPLVRFRTKELLVKYRAYIDAEGRVRKVIISEINDEAAKQSVSESLAALHFTAAYNNGNHVDSFYDFEFSYEVYESSEEVYWKNVSFVCHRVMDNCLICGDDVGNVKDFLFKAQLIKYNDNFAIISEDEIIIDSKKLNASPYFNIYLAGLDKSKSVKMILPNDVIDEIYFLKKHSPEFSTFTNFELIRLD